MGERSIFATRIKIQPGKVQEWLIWLAWKAGMSQGIKGSNPFLSAESVKSLKRWFGAFSFSAVLPVWRRLS